MPRTARDVPPPLELLCLRALWTLGEGNVKDVLQIVMQTRSLAYTTIMTVLDRLVRKGKVSRRKVGRAFVYKPEASRDQMRRAALRELLDGFFDGSERELIAFLEPAETRAAAAGASSENPSRIDTVLL
jgi:BlaI family transcriptional regulator, penicillinase repressor